MFEENWLRRSNGLIEQCQITRTEAAIATVMMQIMSGKHVWTWRRLLLCPSPAPVSSKANESCWFSDKTRAQKKILAKKTVFWRQKSAFGSIKHLLQFFPLIQSELAGTVTAWLASRSQLYLFTIWHVKSSTRHKSSSFGVFRIHSFSVMSYQEQNYLTSICLRHCLTRRRREGAKGASMKGVEKVFLVAFKLTLIGDKSKRPAVRQIIYFHVAGKRKQQQNAARSRKSKVRGRIITTTQQKHSFGT